MVTLVVRGRSLQRLHVTGTPVEVATDRKPSNNRMGPGSSADTVLLAAK
jgi:hypothetical protein